MLIASGPTLLGFLDSLDVIDRDINAPLTLPVSERYNDQGTTVMGKIETGRVKRGGKLLLMPNRVQVEVAAITTEDGAEIENAFAGDNVRIKLKGVAEGAGVKQQR